MQDESDDLGKNLQKQRDDLIMNDTWGSRKKNFYGRDKKTGDDVTSSSDDEDERLEALRLQKVRAKKLQAMAHQSEVAEEVAANEQ